MGLTQLRQRLEQEKGKFQQIQADIVQTQTMLASLQTQALDIEQAAMIHRTVAQQTQERLSWYIDDLVTAAIEAVFPDDPPRFRLEFVPRRGRTEADLWLTDSSGNKIKPSDDDGGGLVNVVAFALRIALWSLTRATRPVIILDEPFVFLHNRDAHARVAEMLRTITERLNLQIIMVTGEDESEEIIGAADKVFRLVKKGAVSKCL
jgi:DNA repair exonuclease SbcCD ATPase subunit